MVPNDKHPRVVQGLSPRRDRAASQTGRSTGSDEHARSLAEPGWEFWSAEGRTDEAREKYLVEHLYKPYMQLVAEFHDSADMCVERYGNFRQLHERWRHIVIITTGLVAILNAGAALLAGRRGENGQVNIDPNVALALAAIAALAAAVLALLANLENFGNHLERAHAYREARELFLDAEREFDRLWQTHVVAFWPRPEACVNARELYRRICIKDSELRRKVKDLTQPRTGHGGT